MSEKTLEYYIDRYLRGSITQEEFIVLRLLLNDPEQEQLLETMMEADLAHWEAADLKMPVVIERVQQGIMQKIALEAGVIPLQQRTAVLKTSWFRYSAAAIMILSIGAIFFWGIGGKRGANHTVVKTDNQTIIAPGREGAVLTLADGRTISLDSLPDGQVAVEGGSKVIYADGNIRYQSTGAASDKDLLNTMSTPKGRQFQLQLPDGSNVWLNAASSITYPVAFSNKERKIKVKGEVYLEVKPDSRRPFLVDIDAQGIVEVLGTSFNINAYDDEPGIRTSLIDGLIRVRTALPNGKTQVIKPGQQVMQEKNLLTVSDNINLSNVLAWKNGLFNLEGVSVEELLRQVARWYDLAIIYKSKPPKTVFHGELGRNLQLTEILEALKEAEIKYSQNGRTLVIE